MGEVMRVPLNVSTATAQRLLSRASAEERQEDALVEDVLRGWLDEQDRRDALTLEAMAKAENGDVVDHDLVRQWIESLDTDNPLPPPEPHAHLLDK